MRWCCWDDMMYNLGYFSDNWLSLNVHLYSQNLNLFPHPTFHNVDLFNCCPCWGCWDTIFRSLHHMDSILSLGAPSRLLHPPYFDSSTLAYVSPWFWNKSHFHFPSNDILNKVMSLTPSPPSSFGKHTVFHRIQAILFCSNAPPHKKFLCNLTSLSTTCLGTHLV